VLIVWAVGPQVLRHDMILRIPAVLQRVDLGGGRSSGGEQEGDDDQFQISLNANSLSLYASECAIAWICLEVRRVPSISM
jgi:hypothetical protein